MHLLLTNLKVIYMLCTPIPEVSDEGPIDAFSHRSKWENNNYITRGHILNNMCNALLDNYQNVESTNELLDSLESKYMAKHASSVKFFVSNFNNYKMVDSRPMIERFHDIQHILGKFAQPKLKMVSPFWCQV
ncbi:unnamed protein product [Rhodiola kirilowii]